MAGHMVHAICYGWYRMHSGAQQAMPVRRGQQGQLDLKDHKAHKVRQVL